MAVQGLERAALQGDLSLPKRWGFFSLPSAPAVKWPTFFWMKMSYIQSVVPLINTVQAVGWQSVEFLGSYFSL